MSETPFDEAGALTEFIMAGLRDLETPQYNKVYSAVYDRLNDPRVKDSPAYLNWLNSKFGPSQ